MGGMLDDRVASRKIDEWHFYWEGAMEKIWVQSFSTVPLPLSNKHNDMVIFLLRDLSSLYQTVVGKLTCRWNMGHTNQPQSRAATPPEAPACCGYEDATLFFDLSHPILQFLSSLSTTDEKTRKRL